MPTRSGSPWGPTSWCASGGNVGAGEFRVVDRSTIRFRPPAGFASGDLVRVRLIVNGAECLPSWYVAP